MFHSIVRLQKVSVSFCLLLRVLLNIRGLGAFFKALPTRRGDQCDKTGARSLAAAAEMSKSPLSCIVRQHCELHW